LWWPMVVVVVVVITRWPYKRGMSNGRQAVSTQQARAAGARALQGTAARVLGTPIHARSR
jgi:hypothetical protein